MADADADAGILGVDELVALHSITTSPETQAKHATAVERTRCRKQMSTELR